MSAEDDRHIRELEARCLLLERAFLIQEKRVWSQNVLEKLERGEFMPGATAPEKARTRELLEGNLRVAQEVLDRLALDLGYDAPSIYRLIDPEFVYGAPDEKVPRRLREQLERVEAREREAGRSHLSAMFRDLKGRHDEFLREVQQQVQDDVKLHTLFSDLPVPTD